VLVIGQVRSLLGSKTQNPTWHSAAIQEQFGLLIQKLEDFKISLANKSQNVRTAPPRLK
jgi:hypothetical protein